MDRRGWLRAIGAAGIASVAGNTSARAAGNETDFNDTSGILADLTACIGCRMCEAACAESHGRPVPEDMETRLPAMTSRQTSATQWTVMNLYETSRGPVSIKRQCMHCNTPACTAACLTKALVKTEEGPVIWREDKCMGCRYCMLSCPFDMPKFEYDSPNPRIEKCRMCWERLDKKQVPACVENCGGEALTFGKRRDLLDLAHKRIAQNPKKYVNHIYGEHEAGGTAFMYLSPAPFEELGLPTNVGQTAIPEYTRNFLGSVPIILTLWPAFLIGLHWATEPTKNGDH
jgi:Fe-S-cluster-containing dehydrogenase component